jgi:hypothetical protein
VYFRREILHELDYLDETLHYVMDWDILIRIGKRYGLEYIPQYMGCLREYPEAKSFAGGATRIRELSAVLKRHTGMRLPPGYIVYGLDTYRQIWCDWIASRTPVPLETPSRKLRSFIFAVAERVISRTIHQSQGKYSDGWAGKHLHFMLSPGRGSLILEGTLPDWGKTFQGQELKIRCNGIKLARVPVPVGDFRLSMEVPEIFQGRLLDLKISATRCVAAEQPSSRRRRRLSFLLKSIRWSEPFPVPAATGAGVAVQTA